MKISALNRTLVDEDSFAFDQAPAQIHSNASISVLAEVCATIAAQKGFGEEEEVLREGLYALGKAESGYPALPADITAARSWLSVTILQAEIARIHSELSEWVEAIRHGNPPDQHCPEFSSAEIEAADAVIRIMHSCASRGYQLQEAIYAKLLFNLSRPHKHGKNS